MKMVKKILLWIATVIFGIMALAYLPHLSAVCGLLTVALLLPVEKWQALIRKVIRGKWKGILAVVLAMVTLFTLPVSDVAEPTDASVSEGTTTVSTATTTAESTTAASTEAATTTTKKITTQKTTTTTKATTITKAPTTTTKKVTTTTTTKKITTTKKTTTAQKTKYVLNTESKKFHYITCGKLPTKNREDVTMSREEIIRMGYSPCGICKP